jgi:hypothetical protein
LGPRGKSSDDEAFEDEEDETLTALVPLAPAMDPAPLLDPLDRLALDRSTGEPEAFPPDAPPLPLLALPAWWRLSKTKRNQEIKRLNNSSNSFRVDATRVERGRR